MKKLGFTSKEAVNYLLKDLNYKTYYGIALKTSKKGKTIQPIQLSDYHKGKRRMSNIVAQRFYTVFGITITDVYNRKGRPSEWE